ncbi:unnamed protein product [Bursaphelenchus okinawaensis]|uniref:Transcriptional adapter 2-beta n=1 Tax=Bursaphelenchus okinawaensis TaxID=465554 RepID=A0A811KJD6_9BILA|nr:unnamed protein product [Bursaphelenchus okinawaensis]CAG9104032.1 unnamed protein product [Bursaphelenchus okinawaensis]
MRPYKRDTFDYTKVLNVIVDMKPADVHAGPVAKQTKKQNLPAKMEDIFCVICLDEITNTPHIRCTECTSTILLCVNCFRLGGECGTHHRGHNYQIMHDAGPSVFTYNEEEGDSWGVLEDLKLLELMQHNKIHEWPQVDADLFNKNRTVQEAKKHFDNCFLNSVFGHLALSKAKAAKVHVPGLVGADSYSGEFFRPSTKAELRNELLRMIPYNFNKFDKEKVKIVPKSLKSILTNNRNVDNLICEFSTIHIDHNPSKKNDVDDCYLKDPMTKLNEVENMFDMDDEVPVIKPVSPKRERKVSSPRKTSNSSVAEPSDRGSDAEDEEDSGDIRYKFRRRESPQNVRKLKRKLSIIKEAKTEPQLLRKRQPKKQDRLSISPRKPKSAIRIGSRGRTRLEKPPVLSPQLKPEVQDTPQGRRIPKKRPEHKTRSTFTVSEIVKHRMAYPHLHFFTNDAPPLNKLQIKGFDAEDLNLVAYNPRRDDFEHEYRNNAEDFICKIFLNGEQFHETQVDQLKNAVRVARVHRYNRILERRISNHAICREHELLSEFLHIVKTNVNERNKYAPINEDAFPSKKRADECRPFLAKLRRLMTQDELLELTDDLGEIDALVAKIRALRQFQMSGITELKGRYKPDFTPGRRRKKGRRSDYDTKKAELRWNRIKKWNKQNK